MPLLVKRKGDERSCYLKEKKHSAVLGKTEQHFVFVGAWTLIRISKDGYVGDFCCMDESLQLNLVGFPCCPVLHWATT